MLRKSNTVIIDVNWNPVFNFATLEVTIVAPTLFIITLRIVTKKSLEKINKTIHGKTMFDKISIFKKTKNAERTKILSASGSINNPNLETAPNFLANFPSRASVIDANTKIINEMK